MSVNDFLKQNIHKEEGLHHFSEEEFGGNDAFVFYDVIYDVYNYSVSKQPSDWLNTDR